MCERYNGWTNYATWCVNLWINNDETDQRRWEQAGKDWMENAGEDEDRAAVVTDLADEMQDYFAEHVPDKDLGHGVYLDLLRYALGEVNWREIAEHFITE